MFWNRAFHPFGPFGPFRPFGSFHPFGSFGSFHPFGSFGSFHPFGSFGSFRPFGSFHIPYLVPYYTHGPDASIILIFAMLFIAALPIIKISHEVSSFFEKLDTQCMCKLDWKPGQEMYVQVHDWGGNSTHFRAPRCSWYC